MINQPFWPVLRCKDLRLQLAFNRPAERLTNPLGLVQLLMALWATSKMFIGTFQLVD